MDLKRVYSGPGSDKDRSGQILTRNAHLPKKFRGPGKSVSEMFLPDPFSPSLNVTGPATLAKKFPGSAKSVSEMFMPDPDSPSL
jgi:hypothetical protein